MIAAKRVGAVSRRCESYSGLVPLPGWGGVFWFHGSAFGVGFVTAVSSVAEGAASGAVT